MEKKLVIYFFLNNRDKKLTDAFICFFWKVKKKLLFPYKHLSRHFVDLSHIFVILRFLVTVIDDVVGSVYECLLGRVRFGGDRSGLEGLEGINRTRPVVTLCLFA